MLAFNNVPGITASPGSEFVICEHVSDGFAYLVGFTGTGSYSAEYRLYVGDECHYVYQTSPGNRTAYVADRAVKIPPGVTISLRVVHNDSAMQTFKGTILGGK